MIILVAIAVIVVSAPAAAVALVALASRREDAAYSLLGQPSGPMEAAARRLVGFYADSGPAPAAEDLAGRPDPAQLLR